MDGKADVICLDLETYRARDEGVVEDVTRAALAKRPAKNARKNIQTEWDTSAAREARLEEALAKTALDPLMAEILCMCWGVDNTMDLLKEGMGGDPGAELLAKIQGGVADCMRNEEGAELKRLATSMDKVAGPETVWVGHNIVGFDLPILLNRFRRFDVCPPAWFPSFRGGRWHGRIYDTMTGIPTSRSDAGKTPPSFVSLDRACRMYGIGGKESEWDGAPLTGARVGAAFEAGAYDKILEYCALDVAGTLKLYWRLTCGGTWGTYSRDGNLAGALAAIEGAEGLSEEQKALARSALEEKA